MQTDLHWQEQTLARFLLATRQHLGLMQAPAGLRPPHRATGSSRKLLRSLVVASSLGAMFGAPAFASEVTGESAKRSLTEPRSQVEPMRRCSAIDNIGD